MFFNPFYSLFNNEYNYAASKVNRRANTNKVGKQINICKNKLKAICNDFANNLVKDLQKCFAVFHTYNIHFFLKGRVYG